MNEEIYFSSREENRVRTCNGILFHHAPLSTLTTGNGRVNANWAPTGFFPSSLMAVPALNWFSRAHKGLLQFGWWDISLILDGEETHAEETRSWYDTNLVLHTEFVIAGNWKDRIDVEAFGLCPLNEDAFVHVIRFVGRCPKAKIDIDVRIRGANILGKEAGYLYDGAGNFVCPGPAGALSLTSSREGFAISQDEADLFCRFAANRQSSGYSFSVKPDSELHRGKTAQFPVEGERQRDIVNYEADYSICLKGKKTEDLHLYAIVGNTQKTVMIAEKRLLCAGPASLLKNTTRRWKAQAAHLMDVSMPDKILEAGFLQGLSYAKSNAYDFDDVAILHADHTEYPLDLSRDSYYISSALLYLDPEISKRHLRFYFEKAIPQVGVGTSYVASCPKKKDIGHFLLDAVAYPVLELYRYWRFSGDGEFLKEQAVREGLSIILRSLQKVHSKTTGLYSSGGRSSDEACTYPFFIPGNMLVAVMFENLAEIYEEAYGESRGAARLLRRAKDLRHAIETYGVIRREPWGRLYAFETDGHNKHLLYDHADMPNLLTAPWFGYCPNDSDIYRNTLKFIYSDRNQGYRHTASGRFAALCDGSKCCPDAPWPMAAMGHILALPEDAHAAGRFLDMIAASMSDNLLIPEIIDRHTGRRRSRQWFTWPPALFVITYIEAICGIRVGKTLRVEPHPPEGWDNYASPTITVRGNKIKVRVRNGKTRVFVNAKQTKQRVFRL